MQKKKGKRINFNIVHCSGEDPDYPVSELLQQTADAKGWQSRRFPTYPETIVVELIEVSIINKIAVLSHQSKIATKIQFEIKVNQTDDWKKLGRISLDSNVNTNFQARELKQANINDVVAKFIRIILRENHANDHNLFKQVGLISVSFYGVRSQQLPPVKEKIGHGMVSNNEIDTNTLNRIKQLEAKKKRAVEQENYDVAKDIKDEIDRLRNNAAKIANLQERKQEAIKKENYDDAKLINEEIKRIREGRVQTQEHQPRQTKQSYQPKKYPEEERSSVSPITNTRTQANKPQFQQKRQQKKEVYEPTRTKTSKEQEDRPITIKNINPYDEGPQKQERRKETEIQQLNKQLEDECSQFFSVLDQDIFRHIFSKDHVNRQKGIEMVSEQLKKTRSRQDFIGACLYVIKNLIDDKIASVLIAVIGLFSEMLKKLKPQSSSYNQPLLDFILDKLGDYLGHINEKIKGLTQDIYASLPMYHLTNKEICYRALSAIGKRDKPPKVLTGRLKMICKLVKNYQLGKDYQQVIKYAVKYADDKNSDVRNAAIATLCSIANEIDYSSLQPFLKGLRPPIIKSIEQKLDENRGEQQNFDEKPIKTKGSEKGPNKSKQQTQQDLDVGNEFIQIPRKGASKSSQNAPTEDITCQFCKRVDKRFLEQDYLDMHYFNACPMLIICSECGQGIEVSALNGHLVGECSNSKYFKRCPRCKEAVMQKNYKTHVQKKQCMPAKPMAAANRCPLCHLDINPGVNGWKEHLVDEGCENNPRA